MSLRWPSQSAVRRQRPQGHARLRHGHLAKTKPLGWGPSFGHAYVSLGLLMLPAGVPPFEWQGSGHRVLNPTDLGPLPFPRAP